MPQTPLIGFHVQFTVAPERFGDFLDVFLEGITTRELETLGVFDPTGPWRSFVRRADGEALTEGERMEVTTWLAAQPEVRQLFVGARTDEEGADRSELTMMACLGHAIPTDRREP